MKLFIQRNRSTPRALCAAAAFGFTLLAAGSAQAAPTDIVPRGSSLLDAFATLSKTANAPLGANYTPFNFLEQRLWTRQELADLFAHNAVTPGAAGSAALDAAAKRPEFAGAVRAILAQLQPEFKLDGYSAKGLADGLPDGALSYDVLGKLESRSDTHGSGSDDGGTRSGVYGVYRGTAQGNLSSSARYAVSVSNWPEDYRRLFYNDTGNNDQTALQEAYIELAGRNGFRFDIGRLYDNWGPGQRGGDMLSDNSPAFDQLQVTFPFSLGRHLGRNYSFEQMASTFQENGSARYLEVRRVGYQFSKAWNFSAGDAFKTNYSSFLLDTPLPFHIGQDISIKAFGDDSHQEMNNQQVDTTLTFSPSTTARLYGQLFIDDIRDPINLDITQSAAEERNGFIERKIAYLLGAHDELSSGTGLTAEYSTADPFTYTYRNNAGIWQHGNQDWIGFPEGPNFKQFYARIDQRFGKPLTLGLEFRDRQRWHDSFPAPESRTLEADGNYALGNANSVGLAYTYYRQDRFPFNPATFVGPPYAPSGEGDYGRRVRVSELEFSYSHLF